MFLQCHVAGQKFALMEEKVVLAYLLRNYKIKSTQTVDDINPTVSLILRPDKGLYVTLEQRKE